MGDDVWKSKKELYLDCNGVEADENGAFLLQLRQSPFLGRSAIAYFFCRYIFLPLIYLPVVSINTLVLICVFHRQNIAFNGILFLITFPISVIALGIYLSSIGAWYTGLIQGGLMWHCVQLCYFIADSKMLVNFQLGFLLIYLTGVWSMLYEPKVEKKSYRLSAWFCHQQKCWENRHDEQKAALDNLIAPDVSVSSVEGHQNGVAAPCRFHIADIFRHANDALSKMPPQAHLSEPFQ